MYLQFISNFIQVESNLENNQLFWFRLEGILFKDSSWIKKHDFSVKITFRHKVEKIVINVLV